MESHYEIVEEVLTIPEDTRKCFSSGPLTTPGHGNEEESSSSSSDISVARSWEPRNRGGIDMFTSPNYVGVELGEDIGIDDVVFDEDGKDKSFSTSTPMFKDFPGHDSAENFLGLHRSDTHFAETMDDGFETVGDSKMGQDLRDTFIQMEYRKVIRMTAAKYREDPRSWVWAILYTLAMATYLFVKWRHYINHCSATEDTSFWNQPWEDPNRVNLMKEVVLVLLLGICFVSITDNFQSLATTLTVYFLYLLVVLYFMLGSTYGCAVNCNVENCGTPALFELLAGWVVIVSIVWLVHLFYYYIAPFIVRHTRMCFGWRRLRSVTIPRPNANMGTPKSLPISPRIDGIAIPAETSNKVKEVVFQYRPLMSSIGVCWAISKYTFLYRGEMRDGRPDGWGQWRDDSFNGESLAGYWKDGLPQGPFVSCEKGTGNIFSAVLVGYCSMRTEDWRCLPEDERDGILTFGLASVECCISGDFYANFPNLKMIPESTETCSCILRDNGLEQQKYCSKISKMIPQMRHIESNQVLSSVVVSSTAEGDLTVTGHLPDIPEHGRTASISAVGLGSSNRVSNLVIDNWHYQTANEAIIFIHGYNIPLEWALRKFGQMLTGAGYPSYIKPFLFSWPTGKLFFYSKALEMCTHPNTVSAFTHFLLNLAHAGTKAIHILSHSMGIRLFLHAFSKPEVRALFASRASEPAMSSIQMQLASVTICNPDYSLTRFRDHDYDTLRLFCSLITIYSDQGDAALKYSAIFANELSLGRLAAPLMKPGKRRPLDLDVIDTTDLQNNMHTVRHSAFNVNRIILEDMREVIVQKRRAVYRSSRLVKKQHNFFVFMTIPSMVDGNVV